MYGDSEPIVTDEELKEFKREFGLSTLMGDSSYKFVPKFNNLRFYNKPNITRRKLVWGFLPIGEKYIIEDYYKENEFYQIIKMLSDKYDFIVTGSVALRIFGVLDRNPKNDIDIIASEETIEQMKNDLTAFKYTTDIYGSPNAVSDLNLKASFKFEDYKYMKVDAFCRENVDYEILDGIKIARPFDVISMKLKAGRNKDLYDCKDFMSMIKKYNKKLVTDV